MAKATASAKCADQSAKGRATDTVQPLRQALQEIRLGDSRSFDKAVHIILSVGLDADAGIPIPFSNLFEEWIVAHRSLQGKFGPWLYGNSARVS